MVFRRSLNCTHFRSAGFALALALSACGSDDVRDGSNTGGVANLGGTATTGGENAGGGQTATGGSMGQAGGTSSGGASGGASQGEGGTSGGGVSSGGGAGGSTAGTGGSSGEGSGGEGAGGAASGECTRALLDGLLDDYFAALSGGDPSTLPLADNLKFTENAQEAEIGTTEFWMKAGELKHSQRALDTELCSVGVQAVIPEDGMDLPVAIRIKVEDGKMTEIETIVVRPGDYTASFAVDSNPAAIIAIADEIGWHDEVPEAERATREELLGWIDKYFRSFPSGVCDVTGDCTRLENGGGDFSCTAGGASCTAEDPGPGGTLVPRIILADEERGIAIGLTIFDFQTTGHLDMHMIKMAGGQVHAVQAILRDTNGESGWD